MFEIEGRKVISKSKNDGFGSVILKEQISDKTFEVFILLFTFLCFIGR
jgi:hypothetical protein